MTNTHATSPELTSGAGFTYEDTVVAYYLTALLREEGAAGQDGVVTRVAVQQSPEFPLDDLVVQFRHRGSDRTLSLQVRRRVVISGADRNVRFHGILGAAARTLAAPGFVRDSDAYGFIAEYAADRRLRDLKRLIELAETSPDGAGFERHFEIPGATSQTVRQLRAKLSASIKAGSPEEERQFYRHFVALRLDGLSGHGPLAVDLLNRLRELTDVAAEGVALLDTLRTVAREGAGAAQSWTRESLIRQLRDRVALTVSPSYASDMSGLVDFSKAAMADISDEIAGVRVDRPRVLDDVREQLARHRLVNLSGLPGSGKSAVLKRAAKSLANGGPLLFLKHDRIENRSWGAFAAALGLEHDDPVQILAEIGISGAPTLFIDGIDRIDPEHKGVVLDLVRAIEGSEHLDHWRVLASSRDQGLEGYRTWFPESFHSETGIGDVAVLPFDLDEAIELARKLPALSPLLLGSGSAAEVARRPFFAAVLARSGVTREAAPQTEIDLVAAWWRGGGHEASPAAVVQRQRALLDVAVKGLRTLGRKVPTQQLSEATLNQLPGLVADGLLQSMDDGGWYSFAHDIFFEWALFRRLVELEGDWTAELVRTGEPPLLGRVVGLLAQKALEVPDKWASGYRRLEAPNLRPQWRREWLTAPPLTSAFANRQAEFAGFLKEDNHRLLGKFLLWFQAHHTTPNAEVLASSDLPGEAERIRFADLLGWPSDIAAWVRILGWLIPTAPSLPKRFAPAVVQVFSVWQNAFARSAYPQSAAIVDLCSRWLVELEDVLYSPREGAPHETEWSDLGSGSKDLATNLRLAVARSATTYPEPLRELYKRAVRSADMRRSSYAELMALASTAAEVCPETLAVVTKAELMVELPGDRAERRRLERNMHYAALRRIREKPENERTPQERRAVSFPLPLPSEDRVDPDDVGIKRFVDYYSPPSPVHNPFAVLLEKAPETGLALVRDIVNHAVQGWRQNDGLRGADAPLPVTLSFPWGEQEFWGDTRHYDWFTIQAWPEPLECALLALRHWAFKELDRGRPVDEVIRAVVERNTCYGVLGLALAVAIETLHASETVLPIVTCQRLWHDDLRRFVQEETKDIDLLGLGLQPRLHGDQAAAKAYLDSRQSRKREIQQLAMRFAISGSSLREQFAGLLARFPDDLPYTTEGQRADEGFTDFLRGHARRWAELGDVGNYSRIEVDGEPAGIAFQSPTPQTNEEKRQAAARDAYFEETRVIGWATRCLQEGRFVDGMSMGDAIRVAKDRDHAGMFDRRRDAVHHSPQTVVSAVAAAVLLDGDLGATDREWAWDVMARVEVMREPADASPGSRIHWHPAGHLVAALATDRRADIPRADSVARLMRLTLHPVEEDVARRAFAVLLADSEPQVQWVAGRLALALSIRPRPFWRRDGAGTNLAAARELAVAEAIDGLSGSALPWPELPVPWKKEARPSRYAEDWREPEEWVHPDPYFEATAAAKLLPMFPVESWCRSSSYMPALREGLNRLVGWTAAKLVPDWEAAPGDDTASRAAAFLMEWNHELGRLLSRAAPCLDVDVVREHLDPFPVDNEDSFSVLAEFVVDTVVRHVIDAPTMPDHTLTLLADCADRVLRHPAFLRAGYRDGELHGRSLRRVVRALLFVPLDEEAPGSARFANGDWSELSIAMPVVSQVVAEVGWSREVMDWFLQLCERAGSAYPIESFANQVLPVVTSTNDRWSGTTIPARVAATIQRLADANYPIDADLARRLLVMLDALVELGDRRSVALERSPTFRKVREA